MSTQNNNNKNNRYKNVSGRLMHPTSSDASHREGEQGSVGACANLIKVFHQFFFSFY